jgi:hypothetical protein
MTQDGWLDEPQEWRAIPNEAGKRRVSGKSSVKHQLDMIVKAGAARQAFLLRREPLERRTKLKNAAGGPESEQPLDGELRTQPSQSPSIFHCFHHLR